MTALEKRAYAQLLCFMIGLAAAIFVTAWSLEYWQAWLFLAVFFGSSLAIISYLARHDPKLLERRMNAGPRAEKELSQKIIQVIALVTFFAMTLLPAIDQRYRWSSMSPAIVIAGDILVMLGYVAVFFVFTENSYASSVIEIGAGQKVVTTGPYAVVRHPMYSGALVLLLGIPLALGSWWGLLTMIPITAALVWRLLDEEKFLARNLTGYSEYQNKVRYRLLPSVW
jgi:protein-S-isoprenylcysteine O-methyltransferase Ste14